MNLGRVLLDSLFLWYLRVYTRFRAEGILRLGRTECRNDVTIQESRAESRVLHSADVYRLVRAIACRFRLIDREYSLWHLWRRTCEHAVQNKEWKEN